MKTFSYPLRCSLAALACLLLPAWGQAFTPPATKLFSRHSPPQEMARFGTAVALSDTYLLVGEANFDANLATVSTGAVHLFQAQTGRFLRRIAPSPPVADHAFGTSVAIFGDLLAIGVPGDDGSRGAVFLYHARTGRLLHKLTAPGAAINDRMGESVAMCDGLVLAGAPRDDSSKGTVSVFDAATGAFLRTLTAPDGAANDQFGYSLSMDGHLALIGAPLDDSTRGSAYLMNARTGVLLKKHTAVDGAVGDYFGNSVALSGRKALIGAPYAGSGNGAAYVHDLASGAQIQKLSDGGSGLTGYSVALDGDLAMVSAPARNGSAGAAVFFQASTGEVLAEFSPHDGTGSDNYGYSVALKNGVAVAGSPGDDDFASGGSIAFLQNTGSVYHYRGVAGMLPLTSVARQREAAAGVPGASYSRLGDAVINDEFVVAFTSTLSNRRTGVWHGAPGALEAAVLPGDDVVHPTSFLSFGSSVASMRPPLLGNSNSTLVQANLRGAGLAGGSQALARPRFLGNVKGLLAAGGVEPFAGQSFQSFTDVAQKYTTGQVSAAYRLRRSGGVTAANDTGIYVTDANGAVLTTANMGSRNREGQPSPNSSGVYGQFFGRTCFSVNNYLAFPAFFVPTGETKAVQGLFFDNTSGFTTISRRQGQHPHGLPSSIALRSFLAESMLTFAVYRAIVTGTGISSTNNEGLFSEANHVIVSKGQAPDPSQPAHVISRIVGFWPMGPGSSTTVVLVQLRGRGVNGANDRALLLVEASGTNVQVLFREGDTSGQPDAAKVRSIQRVDVDGALGNYVVLASLTGSGARNQALFTGNVKLGNNTTLNGLRTPRLVLRKGGLFQAALGQTTAIRSMSLPVNTDRGGAGAKGLSQSINNTGNIAVNITFNNGAREILVGKP